jgi:Calpain family cysteine protease
MAKEQRQYTNADLYGSDGRPHAVDIDQDRLYNCYFLAPIGALAEQQPERIRDAIRFNPETGDFTVSLYRPPSVQEKSQGQTNPIQESISVSQEDIRRNISKEGGGTVDNNRERSGALWPTVVEAGFAELYGRNPQGEVNLNQGYRTIGAATGGGALADGTYALTGESGRSLQIYNPEAPPMQATGPDHVKRPEPPPFRAPLQGAKLGLDAVYAEVEQALLAGKPVSMATQGREVPDGLMESHAYMVVSVSRNPENNDALVTLRNPYGTNQAVGEGNRNIGPGWNTRNPEITVSFNKLEREGSFAEFNIGPAPRVQTQQQSTPAPTPAPTQPAPSQSAPTQPASSQPEPSLPSNKPNTETNPSISPTAVTRSPDDKAVIGPTTGLQLGNDFRDKGHPGNAAYEKMVGEVQRMETTQGIPHGPNTPLIAAALMVKAEQNKFYTPEIVRMESDGQVSALKLNPFGTSQKVSVDPKEVVAQGQSFEKSTEQWALARSRQYANDLPAAERTQEQVKALAQMTPTDQSLFEKIRQNVPPHISDDVVAKTMLQAKKEGISNADQIDKVAMVGDNIALKGPTAGMRSTTDVNEPAAPMAETAKHTDSFNQQQAIDQRLAQEQALVKKQEQENQGATQKMGGGMAMG